MSMNDNAQEHVRRLAENDGLRVELLDILDAVVKVRGQEWLDGFVYRLCLENVAHSIRAAAEGNAALTVKTALMGYGILSYEQRCREREIEGEQPTA